MIVCPVCQTSNDEFSTTCSQCRGFLQNRIPNLNLFETIWKVIESPRQAFREITLAEHKNYALMLFALVGVFVTILAFSVFRTGDRFESLLHVLAWGLAGGLVLGTVSGPVLSTLHWSLVHLMGGRSKFRSSFGVLAYALVPAVFVLVLVLPVELLTFGMYLFTANPHPYAIKPVSYVALTGMGSLLALWSVVLAVVGTSVSARLPVWKSILVVVAATAIVGGALLFGGRVVLKNPVTHEAKIDGRAV